MSSIRKKLESRNLNKFKCSKNCLTRWVRRLLKAADVADGFFYDLYRWRDISGNFKAEFEQNVGTHHKRPEFSLRGDCFS